MYFILFNGPPRSGKDTAALAVMSIFGIHRRVVWDKFSLPNKFAFAGMMQAGIDDYGNVEFYEENKEKIVPALGVSYRQWQIDYSEKYMKPLYGKDVFARLLLDRRRSQFDLDFLCPVSDCGFQVEVDVLANSYDWEKCLLVRLRREGTSFAGDSREWVLPVQNMKHVTIYNDKTIGAFEDTVINVVGDWLKCVRV